MAALLLSPVAVLPQAPTKQLQGATALAPRSRPRVPASSRRRLHHHRAATVCIAVAPMAARELRQPSAPLCCATCTAVAWAWPASSTPCRHAPASFGGALHPQPACLPWHPLPHAELIDGKAIAEQIRQELKAEVDVLKQKYGKVRQAGGDSHAGRLLWPTHPAAPPFWQPPAIAPHLSLIHI